MLLAHAAATIAACWTDAAVKAQFPLITINQAGQEVGHVYPKFPRSLDTETLRRELLLTGASPNSPASGNAYSRSFLEAVTRDGGFDLDNPREFWMDTMLTCNAPFYGEVISLYKPLSCYRRHDNNLFAIKHIDVAYFDRMLTSIARELEYFGARCRSWGVSFDAIAARNRSLWALECRLMADKLVSDDHCSVSQLSRQPVFRTLWLALRACLDTRLSISRRIIRAGWLVSIAAGPKSIATRLIALRFIPSERPAWLVRAVTTIIKYQWVP
jgi:hypothetical protein